MTPVDEPVVPIHEPIDLIVVDAAIGVDVNVDVTSDHSGKDVFSTDNDTKSMQSAGKANEYSFTQAGSSRVMNAGKAPI
ncbi:hypothetical protein Dimus_026387, partial [Dionaea muscipula]